MNIGDRVAAFMSGRFVGIGSIFSIDRSKIYSHKVNFDDGEIDYYQEEELTPVKRYRGMKCQN